VALDGMALDGAARNVPVLFEADVATVAGVGTQ